MIYSSSIFWYRPHDVWGQWSEMRTTLITKWNKKNFLNAMLSYFSHQIRLCMVQHEENGSIQIIDRLTVCIFSNILFYCNNSEWNGRPWTCHLKVMRNDFDMQKKCYVINCYLSSCEQYWQSSRSNVDLLEMMSSFDCVSLSLFIQIQCHFFKTNRFIFRSNASCSYIDT